MLRLVHDSSCDASRRLRGDHDTSKQRIHDASRSQTDGRVRRSTERSPLSDHGREKEFSTEFKAFLRREGVVPVLCPPRAPNCNAFAERNVRSVKEEYLSNIIPIGAASLRRAVGEYTAHYHGERNHQGLGNGLIDPPSKSRRLRGDVHRRERLGGTLSFYH